MGGSAKSKKDLKITQTTKKEASKENGGQYFKYSFDYRVPFSSHSYRSHHNSLKRLALRKDLQMGSDIGSPEWRRRQKHPVMVFDEEEYHEQCLQLFQHPSPSPTLEPALFPTPKYPISTASVLQDPQST